MQELDALTPEQNARLENEVADWLDSGRSVQPLDRERAADAIRALYTAIGSPTPVVLFFSSPAMCILAWRALRAMKRKGAKRCRPRDADLNPQLRSELLEQLNAQPVPRHWLRPPWRSDSSIRWQIESQNRSRTWAHAWNQLSAHFDARMNSWLGPSLTVRLETELRAQLWRQLRSRLWRPVELQIEDWLERVTRAPLRERLPLRENNRSGHSDERVWRVLEGMRHERLLEDMEIGIHMSALEAVPAQRQTKVWRQVGALMGAWWCASAVFYEFCGYLGVPYAFEQKRLLRLWLDQCRHAHWRFESDGIVFASDRPAALAIDSQGRLHNEGGAALDYGDGFRLFAIHGVRVEEELVLHPQRITVERIENENNVEVRRVLIALYGNARYLKDSGAALVHQDARGKLWRKQRADDADLVMVEVVNSTPELDGSARSYLLRVPPDTRTASAAVAWTFGLQSREYGPRLET